jgi:7,8-dihydropterin-6-yl-methyl-4-(beta-D-ribofuranosyl)aminobenzene 5'-phosphate synthase
MIISVLIENSVCRTTPHQVKSEHGVSLYIELNEKKVLFDVGKSDLFYANAQKMGIDISDVDYLIISHGHFDHGGGIKKFLQINKKAKIYLHKKAIKKHYAKLLGLIPLYIGLDNKTIQQHINRFHFIEKDEILSDDMMILEDFQHQFPMPKGNASLYQKENNKYVKDQFKHEIVLVLKEKEKTVLMTACSHSGIINMYNKAQEALKNQKINAVFGGFHIHNPVTKKNEPKDYLDKLTTELQKIDSIFYTGHCTGAKNFKYLKQSLGDQLQTMFTGEIIKI